MLLIFEIITFSYHISTLYAHGEINQCDLTKYNAMVTSSQMSLAPSTTPRGPPRRQWLRKDVKNTFPTIKDTCPQDKLPDHSTQQPAGNTRYQLNTPYQQYQISRR